MPRETDRFIVNATWLIKLRWVAVIGQMLTVIAVIFLFGIQIDMLWALWTVIGLTAASNLVLLLWFTRWSTSQDRKRLNWDSILGLTMVMDMFSLTALLFASGGPNNPFFLFFFVNLCLSALVLNRNWAWGLNLLALVCFAWLMFDHHQIKELDFGDWLLPYRESGQLTLPQLGLLVAFSACGSVIVYFMTRLTAELRQQQQDLERVQEMQSRNEKLEALGTLAAGAAHELSTPLSTIAVVARDVEKAFQENPPDFEGADSVVEDVHLIRSQLDRCRKILNRMSSRAGQPAGTEYEQVTIEELVNAVLSELPESRQVAVDLDDSLAGEKISVPLDELGQALRGLIQNALDAGPESVHINIVRAKRYWLWMIDDRGPGMTPEILNRVSEPFFTTKQPGKGMGLGLFLAENVIGRLGGEIQIESTPGEGTRVVVRIPEEPVRGLEHFNR
ncbi:MAG: ATP-binding protein [Mariniblastus sp.]|nr:ATP-binding protein [Mariniblastus sp.]